MELERYKELIDAIPEIVFELDPAGAVVCINRAGAGLLGYDPEELTGRPFIDFVSAEDSERARDRLARFLAGEAGSSSGELTLVSKNGENRVPCRISAAAILRNGTRCGIRGVIIDISALKEMENRLQKSEERFRKISDMALEGIVFYNGGKIIDANRSFIEMWGYRLEEIVGRDIMDFTARECHPAIFNHLANGQTSPCEAKGIKRNGELFDVEFTTRSFVQDGEKIFAVVIQDISHKKRIEYMQNHDEFTELLNSRGLAGVLKNLMDAAVHRQKKLAAVTISVTPDRLSVVRDVSQELEGILYNAVPLEIAERLKTALFKEDVIARTGGNEFMTVHQLPAAHDVGDSAKLIRKILAVFNEEFVRGIRLVPSIGVTFFPDDGEYKNPAKILQNSRYACEEAMNHGREYMFYDENSHRGTRERFEFVKDLIIAVREEKCRNFVIHYQPKVNPEYRIVGMEALIRWRHPRWNLQPQGLVPPGDFIAVAEDTGLIVEMGNWVLREACRQTRDWQLKDARMNHIQVAVNVSPKQLNREFLSYLDAVLEETGLAPGCLELEITERETIKEKNADIIEQIKLKNISIAIDDFGIDYSSLSKLPKLPVNTIKLDKSYVEKINLDTDYEHLVDSTIKMVHGFRYQVVAEGVEELGQVDKLFRDMQCDKIQGYYFSAPLPAEKFEKMLFGASGAE